MKRRNPDARARAHYIYGGSGAPCDGVVTSVVVPAVFTAHATIRAILMIAAVA